MRSVSLIPSVILSISLAAAATTYAGEAAYQASKPPIPPAPVAVKQAESLESETVVIEGPCSLAMRFYWEELLEEVNAAITTLREEGVLKQMADRRLAGPAAGRVMPDIPWLEDKPSLIVAVATTLPPMLYADDDGEPTGLDIELLRRVAAIIGRKLVLREMPFDKLLPTLRAGDVHMAAACLTITPEREKIVQFSLPYYAGGKTVLTGKEK